MLISTYSISFPISFSLNWEGGVRGRGVGGYLLEFEWEGEGWVLTRGWRLLTFSVFRMSGYSSWALIRGWVLIRINMVLSFFLSLFFRKDLIFTTEILLSLRTILKLLKTLPGSSNVLGYKSFMPNVKPHK